VQSKEIVIMLDAAAVARAYLQTWNETDEAERNAVLDQYWTSDAQYVDPLMSGTGRAQIGALVGAVHQRFEGFRFRLLGEPNGHGEHVRLSWSFGPEGQEAPIEGSDVVKLRQGRIERVIGFIDKAPPA
jgi:hypothetical protein